MDIKLKSVQVIPQLIPFVKRLKNKVALALLGGKCSPDDAVHKAILDVADEIARYHGKCLVAIESHKAQTQTLAKVATALHKFESCKKNTRDWTQANKLIDELKKVLQD